MTVDASTVFMFVLTVLVAWVGWSMRDNLRQLRDSLKENQKALAANTHAVDDLRGDFKAAAVTAASTVREIDDLCDRLTVVEQHCGLKPAPRRSK